MMVTVLLVAQAYLFDGAPVGLEAGRMVNRGRWAWANVAAGDNLGLIHPEVTP